MKPPKMIDNKKNGTVAEELRQEITKDSKLSVMTAYFTIFAFAELKKELMKVDRIRLLFTDPVFIKGEQEQTREYYLERNGGQAFSGNVYEMKLRNEMCQAAVAKECAKWLETKADIKMFRNKNSAQPRMIYIDNGEDSVCINGTVDFTTDGLGLTHSDRVDSNMCMYGREFTQHFLKMFDELWNDGTAVEDVKAGVLEQIQQLYKENTPEFIYFVTLYHVFHQYLGELTEDNILKTRTGIKDTVIWNKLYQFQKDGVMGAIDKIEKYNG